MSGSEKTFRGKRDRQLGEWKAEHPGSPKKAAQHLHAPGTKTKLAAKKAGVKKTAAKRPVAKKKTAPKKRTTPKSLE